MLQRVRKCLKVRDKCLCGRIEMREIFLKNIYSITVYITQQNKSKKLLCKSEFWSWLPSPRTKAEGDQLVFPTYYRDLLSWPYSWKTYNDSYVEKGWPDQTLILYKDILEKISHNEEINLFCHRKWECLTLKKANIKNKLP